MITATARRIADTVAPIQHILGGSQAGGASTLAMLSHMKFGSAMSMMLTIAEREGAQALDHAVTVSLLSICMSRKLGFTEQDQQVAGLAGLLHDIGELYIDPAYLLRGKRLLPHEWAHIVVHPHTGKMLVDELEAFPPSVGRAVAEHHERINQTGYPRQIGGAAISDPGQVVAIAETVAGVLMKDHPLERAGLALKIIPGEFARPLLASISGALSDPAARSLMRDVSSQPAVLGEHIDKLHQRIESSFALGRAAIGDSGAKSETSKLLLHSAVGRIQNVQRAFISTGLNSFLGGANNPLELEDHAIWFEADVATREIQWRLRDIARDLALHGTHPTERVLFVPLINLLDDDYAAPHSSDGVDAPSPPLAIAA